MNHFARATGMLAVAALLSAASLRARADSPALTVAQILRNGSSVDSAPEAVYLPGARAKTVLMRGDALPDGSQIVAPPHTRIIVSDARGRRTTVDAQASATFVQTAEVAEVRADSGTLAFDVPSGSAGYLRVDARGSIAIETQDGAFSVDAGTTTVGVTCSRGSLIVARTGDVIAGGFRDRVTLRDVLSPTTPGMTAYSIAKPWLIATYPSAAAAESAFLPATPDGVALLNFGAIESVVGATTTARDAFARALIRFQTTGDREAEADATLAGADIAYRQEQYDAALSAAQAARDVYGSLDDTHGVARARMEAGAIDLKMGRDADATAEFEAARGLFERRLDDDDESLLLDQLALVEIRHENTAGAQRLLDEARVLAQRSGDSVNEAFANGALGTIAYTSNELEAARRFYERAAELYEQVGDKSNEVVSLNNVGIAHVELAHFDESRRWFDRALRLARSLDDPALITLSLTNIGSLDLRQRRIPEALAVESDALVAARKSQDKNKQAMALMSLAATQHLLGRDLVSLQDYRDALELFRAIRADVMIRVCTDRIDEIQLSLRGDQHPVGH